MAHTPKKPAGCVGWQPRSQVSRAIVDALHADRSWQSARDIIDWMIERDQLPNSLRDQDLAKLHSVVTVRLVQAMRCGHLERKDALRDTWERGNRKPRKLPTALWRLKRHG